MQDERPAVHYRDSFLLPLRTGDALKHLLWPLLFLLPSFSSTFRVLKPPDRGGREKKKIRPGSATSCAEGSDPNKRNKRRPDPLNRARALTGPPGGADWTWATLLSRDGARARRGRRGEGGGPPTGTSSLRSPSHTRPTSPATYCRGQRLSTRTGSPRPRTAILAPPSPSAAGSPAPPLGAGGGRRGHGGWPGAVWRGGCGAPASGRPGGSTCRPCSSLKGRGTARCPAC